MLKEVQQVNVQEEPWDLAHPLTEEDDVETNDNDIPQVLQPWEDHDNEDQEEDVLNDIDSPKECGKTLPNKSGQTTMEFVDILKNKSDEVMSLC